MTHFELPDAAYDESYEKAQTRLADLGKTIELVAPTYENHLNGQNALTTHASQLDILRAGQKDRAGFQAIDILARRIPTTPQLLGRILLMDNTRLGVRSPVVITAIPDRPTGIRLALLNQPFVPQDRFNTGLGVGLTKGAQFSLAVDARTSSASFGGHDTAPSAIEGAHLGVALTTARSDEIANALVARGDAASDVVIAGGLTRQFGALDMVDPSIVPEIREIDVATLPPQVKFPLYWHIDLDTETGPALPAYPGAAEKLLGAAVNRIGQAGLDQAVRFVDLATRRD